MLFAGVGNVESTRWRAHHVASPTTPGIVGRGFRSVRVWQHGLADGDLFVLTSDGLSSSFDLRSMAHLAPQAIAAALVAGFHKKHDDATAWWRG